MLGYCRYLYDVSFGVRSIFGVGYWDVVVFCKVKYNIGERDLNF